MTKKKNKVNKNKKLLFIIGGIVLILVLVIVGYFIKKEYDNNKKIAKKKEEENRLILEIKNNYNDYMKTTNEIDLYDSEFNIIGKISNNMELELDGIKDKYYKLKNMDYYVSYNEIEKIDDLSIDNHYKNYIVYNENIVTSDNIKLYVNEDTYYLLSTSISLPIIIKDDDRYYVEYDNKLVYVLKDSINEITKNNNTDISHTSSIAVLNYHYVINKGVGEQLECVQEICHTDTQFDEHMKYISDNGFYTASLRDLELFIDGKVQLPSKTVVVTLDDGWYISRAIPILEKYNLHATLFLITSLAPVSDYASNNLELASHTNNLHRYWGDFIEADNETIIDDLKKSREILNNTTYFCYPFYQYDSRVISLLKETGFTMAFAGLNRKVNVGTNKYIVPRYGIVNTTDVDELASIIN